MKRIFLLIIAAALMSSCIAVRNDEKVNKASKTFYVNSGEWEYQDGYYYHYEEWSKLHRDILDGAIVNAYFVNGEAYQSLPFIMFNGDTNTDVYWQRQVDFDFGPGGLTFFYTDSEFHYDTRPEAMEFRVVMIW